jgi:hypothetical protein
LSLRAPLAVPVQIRAPKARRVFRLAWNVGEDGLGLVRGSSFEVGRPVDVTFTLPGGERLELRAEVAGADVADDDLRFVDPPADAKQAIRAYLRGRLGLPS